MGKKDVLLWRMVTVEDRRTFFKAKVFHILATELHRRYYLKGDFGVSIGMKQLKNTDTNPLRGLLGLTEIVWAKKKRLTISEFERALENSIFSWNITDFVEFVTKKPLVLKADEEERVLKDFIQFQQDLDTIDRIFTEKLSEKQLMHWFQREEITFEPFQIIAKAIRNLPTEYTRMPVFAYQQTGNPHAFDDNQPSGILLLQMLKALSASSELIENLAIVEERNQLLDEFYLLRDDINNYVAIKGLIAERSGKINKMWRQACKEECSWNVPLKEVLRMETIRPFKNDKVLIVENSGIYSILIDQLPNIPMICSSGQFTYAVWRLLRKLPQSNTKMYYVGDLDPEGLGMAQTLLNRFPDNMQTVGMNIHNYKIASRPSTLSKQRLKQLRSIDNPKLLEVAKAIIETKQTAMQEGFLDELIAELKSVHTAKRKR